MVWSQSMAAPRARSSPRAPRGCLGTSLHSALLFGWAGWYAAGLVVPAGVEGEFADQFAGVAADDADVQVVDQEADAGSAAIGAEADVVQPAVVAEGDGAAGVDGVVADSVVGGDLDAGGDGLGSGEVGLHRGASTQRPVGPAGVVVVDEPVELALQRCDGGCGGLGGQPLLLGLVKAFDFAAGLRVVGAGSG